MQTHPTLAKDFGLFNSNHEFRVCRLVPSWFLGTRSLKFLFGEDNENDPRYAQHKSNDATEHAE